jgi:hypothetical protein
MSCLVMVASFRVERNEADTTAAQAEGDGENVVPNSERDISHQEQDQSKLENGGITCDERHVSRAGGDGENAKINSWCGIRGHQGPARTKHPRLFGEPPNTMKTFKNKISRAWRRTGCV